MEERVLARKDSEGILLGSDAEGVFLEYKGMRLRGDFRNMVRRLRPGNLSGEGLVRAARIKGADGPLKIIDATAGLGEDSLLLAAAGHEVELYEANEKIFLLLRDAIDKARAAGDAALLGSAGAEPQESAGAERDAALLREAALRMRAVNADSISAMRNLAYVPDVVLLDPMFPEKRKNALTNKKLQLIQQLELPCENEAELLDAAIGTGAKKIIIKRPLKGPYLASVKPDYSLDGKTVRIDCIITVKEEEKA